MAEVGMVIVQCEKPGCGLRFYGWDEASAMEKFKGHKHLCDYTDEERRKNLDRIINERRKK